MKGKFKIALVVLLAIFAAGALFLFARGDPIGSVHPRGPVALGERGVTALAAGVILLIIIPTLIVLFSVAWRYRVENERAVRRSDGAHGFAGELILWIFPVAIVLVLSAIVWIGAHAFDPYKPLNSAVKPLTIQVVALEWKWLFIYPEQGIASVNILRFPERTPINFELTADAPMNSFWIPQLGGQMMAMAGMSTQLHLMADASGDYAGRAVEINGQGFSSMNFTAKSTSQTDFDAWVASVKQSSPALTLDAYDKLAAPSLNDPSAYYGSTEPNLYTKIVLKFLVPSSTDSTGAAQPLPEVPSGAY